MLSFTGKIGAVLGCAENIFALQVINWTGSFFLSLLACEALKKAIGAKRAAKWLGV